MSADTPRRFRDDRTVWTPEGISGKVLSAEWSDDAGEWEYEVEWSDGVTDTQPEGYLDLGGEL